MNGWMKSSMRNTSSIQGRFQSRHDVVFVITLGYSSSPSKCCNDCQQNCYKWNDNNWQRKCSTNNKEYQRHCHKNTIDNTVRYATIHWNNE